MSRQEAGRKGAAIRWGKPYKEPSQQGTNSSLPREERGNRADYSREAYDYERPHRQTERLSREEEELAHRREERDHPRYYQERYSPNESYRDESRYTHPGIERRRQSLPSNFEEERLHPRQEVYYPRSRLPHPEEELHGHSSRTTSNRNSPYTDIGRRGSLIAPIARARDPYRESGRSSSPARRHYDEQE